MTAVLALTGLLMFGGASVLAQPQRARRSRIDEQLRVQHDELEWLEAVDAVLAVDR